MNRRETRLVSRDGFPAGNWKIVHGREAISAIAHGQYRPPLPGPGAVGFGRAGAGSALSVAEAADGSSGIGAAKRALAAVGAMLSGGFGGVVTSIAGPSGGSATVLVGSGNAGTAGLAGNVATAGGASGNETAAAGFSGAEARGAAGAAITGVGAGSLDLK